MFDSWAEGHRPERQSMQREVFPERGKLVGRDISIIYEQFLYYSVCNTCLYQY